MVGADLAAEDVVFDDHLDEGRVTERVVRERCGRVATTKVHCAEVRIELALDCIDSHHGIIRQGLTHINAA